MTILQRRGNTLLSNERNVSPASVHTRVAIWRVSETNACTPGYTHDPVLIGFLTSNRKKEVCSYDGYHRVLFVDKDVNKYVRMALRGGFI